MAFRHDWVLEDIRSDLLPELEARYGEPLSRVEGNRLLLKFRTEEIAICGSAAVNEYVKSRGIPGKLTYNNRRSAILIVGQPEITDG